VNWRIVAVVVVVGFGRKGACSVALCDFLDPLYIP
jgi:hypothetical protein